MAQNVFTPNFNHGSEQDPVAVVANRAVVDKPDQMSDILLHVGRGITVLFVFLLPLFFVPGLWATLGFQKALLALGASVSVLVVLSLLMLRHSRVQTLLPMPWLCFFGFVVVAGVSALFSDSPVSGFRGDMLETGTVAFFAIMAGVMGLPLVLQQSKKYTMRALQALVVSTLLLLLYSVARLMAGPIAAFGSFPDVTTSPIGGFNDLAVFAGLSILVSLVALLQLPLKLALQAALLVVTTLSLLVLAVVNFFFVWIIVGFFGLLMLLYVVAHDRLFVTIGDTTKEVTPPSPILVLTTALVCLASAWFIIMGDVAGAQISRVFDVSYLEVRPSFSATVDIANAVYQDDMLLGTGPNQFVSAWRQHKDVNINETLFWATDFVSGSSYTSTIAVTTGVLGLALLVLFHGWYMWFGIRMLVRNQARDKFWYFVGVVTFAGAVFLWLMSYLYVPGAAILLLAVVLTGLSFTAGSALLPQSVKSLPLVTNQQRGFGLMALAILVISGSVGALFTVGEQYMAYASFNKTQATAPDVATIDQAALFAYGKYPGDAFLGVRSRIALSEMNQLLAVDKPSEVQQQQFLDISSRGLAAATQAIALAPHNPEHYAVLAAIYNDLAAVGVSDALARSTSSLAAARAIDPQNPTYSLIEAQMAVRRGDLTTARAALQDALQKRRTFTEALYLLAQVDIAEGNAAAAIDTTRAIITLEPNNPTRYYQLGILLTAIGSSTEARAAYDTALTLDPAYANARYARALLLVNAGETETALSELRAVQESNQENRQLAALISQLETGTTTPPFIGDGVAVPVTEPVPQTIDEAVTSPAVPDSKLLTPLNMVLDSSDENTDIPIAATVPEPVQGDVAATASPE